MGTVMWGANTDALRDAGASVLENMEVVRATNARIRAEVMSLVWFGSDSDAFRHTLDQSLHPRLLVLEASLAKLARELDAQAEQQDSTSSRVRTDVRARALILSGDRTFGRGVGNSAANFIPAVSHAAGAPYGGDGHGGEGYGDANGHRPLQPARTGIGGENSTWPMSERPDLDEVLQRYQVKSAQMVDVPGRPGDRVTVPEAVLLADRYLAGQTSEFEAIRKQAEEFGRRPGEGDGHGDAMRHAYWSAMMTERYGEDWTREFTIAHEMKPTNRAHEEAMDLYNNEVGRRIALENPGISDADLKDLIQQASNNGELLVIGPDGKITWSDQVPVGQTGVKDPAQLDGQYSDQVGEEPYGK